MKTTPAYQALIEFKCALVDIKKAVEHMAGEFEIVAFSHSSGHTIPMNYMHVILILRGDPDALRAHEESVAW